MGPRASRTPGVPGETPRIGRAIERIIVQLDLDPYLSLTALAGYAGLSVRKLRTHLGDVRHPLPCYRVGGKILVRRSEFDAWMASYRRQGRIDLDRLVEDVLREVGGTPNHSETTVSLDRRRDR